MTIVAIDPTGLDHLGSRLDAGDPVVVPLPSPLPYVVVGTDAPAVNAAKGRARSQPVGIGTTDMAPIEPALLLDAGTIDLARWVCHREGAGVLLPVGPDAPSWLTPAITEGLAFLGGMWLDALAPLLAGRTHVYMSSGNITGSQPAVDVTKAEVMFGADLLVADGDHLRDPAVTHGSSTMIAFGRDLHLLVHRDGINNARFGPDHDGYLDDLRRRWRAAGAARGGPPARG